MRILLGSLPLGVLLVVAAAVSSIPSPAAATLQFSSSLLPPVTKPNVLLVLIDDLRPELSTYFAPSHPLKNAAPAPFLDQLAKESLTFLHAYATYPNCNPSRNSFLTGVRPRRLGLYTKARLDSLAVYTKVVPIPLAFSHQGYKTYGVGKVFHQELPTLFTKFQRESTQNNQICPNPFHAICIELETSLTDQWTATVAIQYLTLHHRNFAGTPFFLAVGFHRPHVDYSCPQWAVTQVPIGSIAAQLNDTHSQWYENGIPASVKPNAQNQIPALCLLDSSRAKNPPPSMQNLVDGRLGYASNVKWVDQCVGRVLQALQDLNWTDSTIVVAMGDHGVHLGEHGSWGKSTVFEETARVPLLIRVPWLASLRGKTTSAMFETIDLIPTLLELGGMSAQYTLPGMLLPDGISQALVLQNAVTSSSSSKSCGLKCFALTEETRCTSSTPWYAHPGAPFIACEIFDAYAPNRADVLAYSLRTPTHRYVEFRMPLPATSPAGPLPDWSAAGLFARVLFNHTADDGLLSIDASEFERVNFAPCLSCAPHAPGSGARPAATSNPIVLPALPKDPPGALYPPPELDGVDAATKLLVTQLSQVVRNLVRDRDAPCNWHGLTLPAGGCACFAGWTGTDCSLSPDFPTVPTSQPTSAAPTTPLELGPSCVPVLGSSGKVCAAMVSTCLQVTRDAAAQTCASLSARLCTAAELLAAAGLVPKPCPVIRPTWTSSACKLLSTGVALNGASAFVYKPSIGMHRVCIPPNKTGNVACCVAA
jgi:iduronate 2-sulfatase